MVFVWPNLTKDFEPHNYGIAFLFNNNPYRPDNETIKKTTSKLVVR